MKENVFGSGYPDRNYTRCDTLKGDYTEQAIKERIAGTRTVKPRHAFSKKTVSKVGLLVDIEAAIRSGKGHRGVR